MATTTPYAASLAASASFSKSLPMAVGYRVMGRRRRRRKMMMTMLHGQIAFQPAVVAATAAVMVGRGGGRGERSRQIVVSHISPFSVRQSQPQHQQQAAWYSTMRGDEQQQRTRRNNQHQHQQHKRLTTRHREEMGEFFKEAVATLKLIQEEYGGVGMGGNEENQAFHRLITGAARFYEPDRALIWLEKMQEAGYTVSRGQHNIVINAFAKKAIYISTQPNVTQSKNTCSRLADKAKMLMEQNHHTDHQDEDDLTPFRETLCNVVLGLLAAKKHQTVLAILAKDGNGKYSNDKTSLLKGGNAHFYAKAAREIGKQRKALFIERSKSFSQMLLIKQQERRKAQKQHKQQQEQGHDYTKEEGKLNNNGQSQQPPRKSKADKYSDTLSQLGNILVSRMLEEIDEEEEEALSRGGGEHNIKQDVFTNALFAVMGGQDHKICKSLIDKICQQGLGPNAIRGIFSAYEMADKCEEAFSFLSQLEDENIKIPPMCYESVIRCAGFLGQLDICVQASHRFIASGYELGGKQIISTLRACALTGEPTLSSHLLSELSLEYHNGEPLQTPLPYAMHIIACFQAGAIQEGLECLETASEANNVHFQVQHLLDMLTALKPVGSEEKEKRKKEATITSIIEKIMTKSKVRVNSSSSSSSIRNTRSMDNKQDNTSSSCINQAEIVKMAASVLVAYDELHAAKRMMLNQSKELPYSSSSSPSSSSIQEKDVIRELKSAIKGVISAEVLEEKVAAVFDAFGITSSNGSSNSTKGSVKMSTTLLTSLLNTYLADKHYKAVEAKFLDFERYGLRPDAYAFSVLMGVARGEKNYHKRAQKANQVLTLMEESKYTTTTTTTAAAAADDYHSHRSTQDLDYVPYVQALKFSIPQKDDFLHLEQDKKHINNSGSVPSSSSSSLRYYYPDLSPLCILERMEKHGLTPNEEVIINAIKACRYLPIDHEEEEEGSSPIIIDQNSVAEAILVKMESYGIPATYPILHALLELYAGGTTKRNNSSTNRAAIGGGGGGGGGEGGPIGQQEKAEEIFRLMSQQDSASSGNSSSSSLSCIRPIDFHLVAKAGRETGDVKHVEKWAELLQDHGFSIDRQFYLTILNTFSNSKDPEGMAAWLQRAKSDGMLTAKEFARYFNIVAVKMALHDKNLEGFYEVATAIVDLKSDNLKSSSANIMLEATQHVKGDKEAIHFFKKVYFIADPKNTVVGRVATVNRKTVEYLIKSFGRDHSKVLLQETNNCPNQWQDMLS
eukprot:jgi/Bigna1/137744/aug1.41_g12452